ncbi:MAG: hypothetical protein ACOX7N_03275 [Lawsonibacter sp.]|jgi:hypothetical protein
MKQDAFDQALMEEMSHLPPPPQTLDDYTPWQASIRKMVFGMALNIFRLEFFYLQYLLPLLGAILLYLGCRSMRRSDPWFQVCWSLSGVLLAVHMSVDILTATPLIQWVTDRPWIDYMLASCLAALQFLLLFSLRAGIRRAFTQMGEAQPKDWLGRGLISYLLGAGVALWSELVPAMQPAMMGYTITNQWLYYGRPILFLALEIYLLKCLLRQSEALAGRGYNLTPAPVRVSGRAVLLGVFSLVLLGIPVALFFSSRPSPLPAVAVTQPLDQTSAATRQHLISLGLPQEVADLLDFEELGRYATAQQVIPCQYRQTDSQTGVVTTHSSLFLTQLQDGEAELSVWAIQLSDGSVRLLHTFRYIDLPSCHLQNQFSIDPSGYFYSNDFDGGLLWNQGETTFSAQVQVQFSGGETAEEVPEWTAWVYQSEFDAFGRRHYSPWFNFAIPSGAENLRGYLAYTIHPSQSQGGSVEDGFGDITYLFLRHQSSLLQYPFFSISDLGGQRYAGQQGAIQTAWATFEFFIPNRS